MKWRNVRALVAKDFSLFFRNRFFAVVTVLGVVFYLVIYFVMPTTVEENLQIGLYSPVMLPVFEQMEGEGLEIKAVDSEEALREGVIEGEYVAGIALPADILAELVSGERPKISMYFSSDVLDETKEAVVVLIREMAYQQAGQPLAVDISEEVLGPDMMGIQIPPRNRMRTLFAVLLIITETMGMANLITEEVERRTINALLVTPVSVKELFTAKAITGIGLAFVQAVVFMTIVGGMNQQPLIMLVALLLGSVLVTGLGFIVAALAKDMMSVMAWSMVALFPMMIPSFGVMFPGLVTGWVKVIPTYYLVETVHRVANFGAAWGDIWLNLVMLFGFDVALVLIGTIALRRRTR
jgi:ABC-2 type transport system permease protein